MNRDMLKKQAKAFCPSWLKKKSCSWSIWIQLESISPCVINPSVYPCASAVHTPLQADASQALLLSAFAVDAPGSPRTRLAQQLHLFPLPLQAQQELWECCGQQTNCDHCKWEDQAPAKALQEDGGWVSSPKCFTFSGVIFVMY